MKTSDLKPLAMTMGDPAGVGPAITLAAWRTLRNEPESCFYVIAPPDLYSAAVPIQLIDTPADAAKIFPNALPVLRSDCAMLPMPGKPLPETATGIIASIETAVSHCLNGSAAGMVTNPINKELLYKAGFKHPGHTEFIAMLCDDTLQPVMLLTGGGLRVALATIHIPLREAADHLDASKLQALARIVDKSMRSDFGIVAPRIAFTGLNPHAGENGTIGREEVDIINPAAHALRDEGINISDARAADTVFAEALSGRFDAVIAMTHDQGLIPVKTLDLWGGVNSTLGLPIIRTSPDHGTGYDAAAAGTARPDSLIAAIRQARLMAMNRAAKA